MLTITLAHMSAHESFKPALCVHGHFWKQKERSIDADVMIIANCDGKLQCNLSVNLYAKQYMWLQKLEIIFKVR